MSRNSRVGRGISTHPARSDDGSLGDNSSRESDDWNFSSNPPSPPGLHRQHPVSSFKAFDSDSGDEGTENLTGGRRRSRDQFLKTNIEAGTALPHVDDTEIAEAAKERPVSWRSLPRKDQLFVLTLARLAEPLTQTSLSSYLFYQLQSFDPSLPDSTISYQAGIIQAAFPFAQFLTAMLWGRFADSSYGGRKKVIYIGLLGTMMSIVGFGFSHSFFMAVAFRGAGGILNGNVGVMRTMISEIIKEKKFQSRAFLVLPMTFNIGVIIGPILGKLCGPSTWQHRLTSAGGLLANPLESYPSVFGPGSTLGGKDGVKWMTRWPYALPNLVSAVFLALSALAVIFFLEETSELSKDNPDYGLRIGHCIIRHVLRQKTASKAGYSAVAGDEEAASSFELQPTPTSAHPITDKSSKPPRQVLPFRRIFTRNLLTTLCAHGILAMHLGSFNSLWPIYLSTPRFDPLHPHPPNYTPHGLFHFTGGLAMPPPRIGIAGAILGVIGISLQLFLYPNLSHRLGTAKSYRIFLALFPVTYALAPFLGRVESWSKPPDGVSGPFIWLAIVVVLFIQVLARTFAIPCTTILVNNVCPHPSVLGTVHGIGQSVSSLTRTFGPVMFAWVFGKGLDMGIVGLSWWLLSAIAIVGFGVAQGVSEGDGHEILMEGEVREEGGRVRMNE
jgi:MFS family permease